MIFEAWRIPQNGINGVTDLTSVAPFLVFGPLQLTSVNYGRAKAIRPMSFMRPGPEAVDGMRVWPLTGGEPHVHEVLAHGFGDLSSGVDPLVRRR
ncbi:hypothetical protein D3C86_841860 [compost metagenome]